MKAISKIIKKMNEKPDKTKVEYQERRPLINLDYKSFLSSIVENGNSNLRKRGINKQFVIAEEVKELIEQLFLYATCNPACKYDLNKGLFFMGSYGTGKTLLMEAFLQLFNQDQKSKRVTMMDAIEFSAMAQESRENIFFLGKKPLLIDDLGKESKVTKAYGSEIEPVRELIQLRYRYGGITFFTSNYNLDSLSNFYGHHNADRLKEMCTFITMTGESRRN